MDNVIIFQVQEKNGDLVDWVKIDNKNDEAVWMLKSTYDAMQAEQSTPSVNNAE